MKTVTKITSKIKDTWVQASVFNEPFNCNPIPPAPTNPKIVDSRILISQRYIPTPAIVVMMQILEISISMNHKIQLPVLKEAFCTLI